MIMEGKEIQHIAAYSHIQLLDTPITDTSHLYACCQRGTVKTCSIKTTKQVLGDHAFKLIADWSIDHLITQQTKSCTNVLAWMNVSLSHTMSCQI